LVTTRNPFGYPLILSNNKTFGLVARAATSVIAPSSKSQSAPLMTRNSPSCSTASIYPRRSLYARDEVVDTFIPPLSFSRPLAGEGEGIRVRAPSS
jgi:hypothetical protein